MTTTPISPAEIIARRDDVAVAAPARPLVSANATGWFTPAVLALASLSLGLALQVNFGQYHPAAMTRLGLALLACLAAVALPNFGGLTLAGWRPDQLVLTVALAVQFALLWLNNPTATFKPTASDDLAPFKAGVALAAALLAVGVSGTRPARAAVPLLLVTYLALGVWVIRSTPAPGVDVYVFQRDACDALLRGVNPYTITFPDVYNAKNSAAFYGAGLSQNGRLLFGYPYPPLSLFLAIPGHLFGDFRYAQLAAMTLAGALIAYARPGGACARSVAAAAMLLFTPRGFFILEAGWTEPFAIGLLAATVFFACRRSTAACGFAGAISFGLLLVSKQYVVLALPLLFLIRPTKARTLLATLLAGAIATLPLVLWSTNAFIHSVVMLQFHQPARPDALSFAVPFAIARGVSVPAWTSFAFAGCATILALWRCPRTPAGFAAGFALVFFAFFATSRQAFCNYYALVLAALCCAIAAMPGCPRSRPLRP
jgi:hypothetical protein